MEAKRKSKLYIHMDEIYCERCVETITLALNALEGVESVSLYRNAQVIRLMLSPSQRA